MIVLQLCTGERIMVNQANIACVREVREANGKYSSQVWVGRNVLKVRQSFEEIAMLLRYEGVAIPVCNALDPPLNLPPLPPSAIRRKEENEQAN